MAFYWLLLGVLAVWRMTHFLNAEDGPFGLSGRLRRLAGSGFWGGLLDCFYCLSLWVAAPVAVALGSGLGERVFMWPALSAGAILLERATESRSGLSPALYYEDKENSDVLRQKQEPPSNSDLGADDGPG